MRYLRFENFLIFWGIVFNQHTIISTRKKVGARTPYKQPVLHQQPDFPIKLFLKMNQ